MSTTQGLQKALLLKQKATAIVLDSHPVPRPASSQVLVKVSVAGLNGHDQKIRDMGIFLGKTGLPAVLANDVVGRVTAVGDGVRSLKVGDRIVSQADFSEGTPQNGLQEYAVLDERFSAKVPDRVTDDDAATLPTNLIASLVALFHDLMPAPWASDFDYKGVTLLIVGGGSTAGRYAVQLARLGGVGRIVVVGGKEDELQALGATHVIDRHGSQVLDRIRKVVADDLVYAYDAVNMPEGQLLALNALSSCSKGCLTRLLPMPVDESKVLGKAAGFEVKNVVGISSAHPELCEEFWKRLPGYLVEGKIVPLAGGYKVIEVLDAVKVNAVLDSFRSSSVLKHAHVYL